MPEQPHAQNQNNELQEFEDREAIALKSFLAQPTQRWQQIRQERGNESAKKELLHGTRLERAIALREAENELLDASLARRDRQNKSARKPNRRQILGLSIFSGVALLLALLAGWQWQRAEKQSTIGQVRAGQVLYLSGNRLEALVETLKAYQQLQKTPWQATGEFIHTKSVLRRPEKFPTSPPAVFFGTPPPPPTPPTPPPPLSQM